MKPAAISLIRLIWIPLLSTLILSLALLSMPSPVQAQDIPATVNVTVLDEAGLPLSGQAITLTVLRYGPLSVERLPAGACQTDAAGQCTFRLDQPPRLADGRAEAILSLPGLGERWFGWTGSAVEIVLTAADLRLQATWSVPNELGYEYETPGAFNSPWWTPEAFTQTPETTAAPLVPTPTPLPSHPDASPGSTQSIPLLIFGLCLALGVALWRRFRKGKDTA